MDKASLRRLQLIGRHLTAAATAAVAGDRAVEQPPLVISPYKSFRLDPLTPSLGAEIFDLDCKRVIAREADVVREVHEAFTKYKVVMFRETKLDREGHLAFMRSLTNHWDLDTPKTEQQKHTFHEGLFVHPYLPPPAGYPSVWMVDARQGKGWGRVESGVEQSDNDYYKYMAELRDGGAHGNGRQRFGTNRSSNIAGSASAFHSDNMFVEQPSSVSSLRAVKLPPVGGDTIFANMEQAYADLDEAMKQKLLLCSSVNGPHNNHPDWLAAARRFAPDEFLEKKAQWLVETFPQCRYPVIRTHPVTGNKSIYVNMGFTKSIEGPCVEEEGGSQAFLEKLYGLAKVPEYQCRMRYRNVGDLIMWDNRCLVHYAVGDYGGENGGARWMDHVATLGSTPV